MKVSAEQLGVKEGCGLICYIAAWQIIILLSPAPTLVTHLPSLYCLAHSQSPSNVLMASGRSTMGSWSSTWAT